MSQAPVRDDEPLKYILVIAGIFTVLSVIRLTVLQAPYFDEIHYLPAAREILASGEYLNREHPLLGKTFMAVSIWLFGDNPLAWRCLSLLAGVITLVASMRAMWHTTRTRFSTLAFGVLLASGFMLLIQSRIAMLDIYMACFLSLAAWQFSAAIRRPEQGRWRLAVTGICLGMAMATKWTAIPLVMLPGVVFLIARLSAGRRRLLTSRRGIPIPSVSLLEAVIWLGIIPLLVYSASFLPGYLLEPNTLSEGGIIAMHREMLALQTQVLASHTYQSNWPDWVMNARAIWYFYEPVDGVQRGVLMLGNPLTMLLGIPALVWCLFTGASSREWPKMAMVLGYLVSLSLWLVADKSVQFYYHYFIPHFFLLGALALVCEALWRSGHRYTPMAVLGGSLVMLAWFYPILTAAQLDGPLSFADYAWIEGWR